MGPPLSDSGIENIFYLPALGPPPCQVRSEHTPSVLSHHTPSHLFVKSAGGRVTIWLAVGLVFLAWSLRVLALEDSNEYKIKAAYLYNFTRFITWPTDSSPTFNVCIVGDDPFGNLIDPIEQRTVLSRPIKVFRVREHVGPNDGIAPSLCHILFSATPASPLISAQATLTVGERVNFAETGGMVEFIQRGGRIKLLINLTAVQNSQIKISAKLLEVAEIIAQESP